MISKIYSNLGFHRFGGAYSLIGRGNVSGVLTNDPTDTIQNNAVTFNTGYFNRDTENAAEPSFTYANVPGTTPQLIFDSRANGYALKSVTAQSAGGTGYIRFNTTSTVGVSGFPLSAGSAYVWNDVFVTQIMIYGANLSTSMSILGIPVDRP